MASPLSRRDLVERCLASGALFLAPSLPLGLARPLFAADVARALPRRRTRSGRSTRGRRHDVDARARRRRACRSRSRASSSTRAASGSQGAFLELWHASSAGLYDNEGYLYRGIVEAGSKGAYEFRPCFPATTWGASASTSITSCRPRSQAPRHPALLRDRPRLRRRPGPELPQGSAHHEPRARPARVPSGDLGTARAGALRDLPRARLTWAGRPTTRSPRLKSARSRSRPRATLSRPRSPTGRCGSTGRAGTCAGPGRPARRDSPPWRSPGAGGSRGSAGDGRVVVVDSSATGASSARSPRTPTRSTRSRCRVTARCSGRRPRRPPRSGRGRNSTLHGRFGCSG